jgi:Ala-tRNA(Pro) deacylase
MSIAHRLRWYLNYSDVDYHLIHHKPTHCSRESAEAAQLPLNALAKPVLLEDERGYLVAVLPASRRVSLDKLEGKLGRRLELASEEEISQLYEDCETGAIHPIARAYRLKTVVDEALLRPSEVYFEAGDHELLVQMRAAEFLSLFPGDPFVDLSEEKRGVD